MAVFSRAIEGQTQEHGGGDGCCRLYESLIERIDPQRAKGVMSAIIWSQSDSNLQPTWVERRSTPRFPASAEPARIAWKKEGLRVSKAPAQLIDIALTGAGLVVARPAAPGDVLWLGMASLPWEWVKATVRASCPDGPSWRFHVAFCEPCPVGLLEMAIGLPVRNREVPSFRILRDHVEQNTCFTIHLYW
jgi:hypothetical protein